MAKKKSKSLLKTLSINYYTALGFILAFVLVCIAIGIVYALKPQSKAILILFIVSLVFTFVSSILFIAAIRRSYSVIYKDFYINTKKNYASVYQEKNSLNRYSRTEYDEFKDLNDEINKIDVFYQNVNILNKYSDYSRVPLEYYSKDQGIVTEKSFKKYIKEIIFISQSFRNAVIQLTYNIKTQFDRATLSRILDAIQSSFKQEGLLISLFDNKNGVYIYVPKLSSRSLLEENLASLFQNLTITNKTINGTELISPKINAVIYPYSNIEDIFTDLNYASHQKDTSFIYIPRKLSKQQNDSLLHSTMNLNAINRFISELAVIGSEERQQGKDIESLQSTLKDIINYLCIDQCGIVLLNEDSRKYYVATNITSQKDDKPVFPIKNEFDSNLLLLLKKSCDSDGSYFFQTRNQVNKQLGKTLDIYGINSGFFYTFTYDNGKHFALIYFVNKGEKELNIDSYIRESLLMCSALISSIINVNGSYNKIRLMKSREDNLYKVTNIKSYNVNKQTFEILDYSSSLKEIIPTIKAGEKCYKAIFGTDRPCKNCPLISSNKIMKIIGGMKSEISFSVNNKASNQVELLITPMKEGDVVRNRFEPDYGVNSLYALAERFDSFYLTKTKGYVVILTLDNFTDLIKEIGNEGFLALFRQFSEDVNVNLLHSSEMFLFKGDTVIVVLPEKGKLDVIDIMEGIYSYAKKDYLNNGKHIELNFAYSAIRFPQHYANAEDYIRNLEKTISARNAKLSGGDVIYVEENDFYRPASRVQYILSIINDAVANNKFIIKAQPIVNGVNSHIDGSELLVRLSDSYRDSMLNTDELIKIAGQNNKLNLISDLLINYICDAYAKYGTSLFKGRKFNHISINADHSYFEQENFYINLKNTLEKYKIPSGFIAFEINESDLAENYNDFKSIIRNLKQLNCSIVCDRYSAEYLSIDRLLQLDINTVKISRDMVKDIEIISKKFDNLHDIVTSLKERNIGTCVVGIENSLQYKLVCEIDKDVYMQGYYFYHPLDDRELVEAVKQDIILN